MLWLNVTQPCGRSNTQHSCNNVVWCVQDITLTEALCGTSFYVQHLDGRVLEVVTHQGEVIKPDSWKCINEEGMPVHGRPYEKGNLYIRFSVKFPESLSSEEVQQLRQVLPAPPQPQAPMSEDEPEQVRCFLSLCMYGECRVLCPTVKGVLSLLNLFWPAARFKSVLKCQTHMAAATVYTAGVRVCHLLLCKLVHGLGTLVGHLCNHLSPVLFTWTCVCLLCFILFATHIFFCACQVHMRPINDMEDELKQRRQYTRNTSNEAYESDSDEEGGGRGGQRVQCAQQ